LKENKQVIRYFSRLFFIIYIVYIFASLLFPVQTMAQQMRTEQIIIDSKIIQNENDPNFFPCAFAHGTFDVLD